jgi:hypothetical protein
LTGVVVAGSSVHWLARPHLATLLFTVLFLVILESRSSRWLWLLPPLTGLWANLHAGFVFGIVLVAVYALEDGAWRRPRLLTALASIVASLANPYGWHLHAHIAHYMVVDSWQFDHVHEFLSPNFHAPLAVCFELMLGLAIAAAAWHAWRRQIHYVVLTVATAHMALVSARHIPLFLMVTATPVSVAITEWVRRAARRVPRASRPAQDFLGLSARIGAVENLARYPVVSVLSIVVLAAVLGTPAASGKFRSEFDPQVFPVRAIQYVRAPGARIFTSDQWGDYLIYRLYPAIHVFVDGRSDFYGAAHEQLCQDVWNVRYDWEKKLARFHVDTLLIPAQTPLAGALKTSGRWRIDYDDGMAIVFRAAGGEPVSGVAVNRPPENQQSP